MMPRTMIPRTRLTSQPTPRRLTGTKASLTLAVLLALFGWVATTVNAAAGQVAARPKPDATTDPTAEWLFLLMAVTLTLAVATTLLTLRRVGRP